MTKTVSAYKLGGNSFTLLLCTIQEANGPLDYLVSLADDKTKKEVTLVRTEQRERAEHIFAAAETLLCYGFRLAHVAIIFSEKPHWVSNDTGESKA